MYYKKIELSILLALVFTIALSCFDFSLECNKIRSKVFRLHILANSDSCFDQNLKLKVRDRIILQADELFENTQTIENVEECAKQNLETFCKIAQDELNKNGCDYKVTAKVTPCYFNTRTYENVTLPAGVYNALQIKIGKAKGKNWWCVIYPSLCLPASNSKIDDALENKQVNVVENKQKYIVKFKVVEWFESFKNLFKA